MTIKPVLAVDVGGVLASLQHSGEPMEGSLACLQAIRDKYEIYIVSQCGKQRAKDTVVWLNKNGFDIPLARQVYINFKEHDKNRVLKEIGATHFIDDRLKHILPSLQLGSIKRVYHFTQTPYQHHNLKYVKAWYRNVHSWAELVELL